MSILPQLLVNALIAGSIYALVSVGLALTYGLLRILNFAHGHMLMTGAYIFYLFSVELNFGLWAASGLTLLVTFALGAFCLAVFVMPFVRFSFLLPFVTTLALSTILESVVSMTFGVNVKSLSSGMDISSIEIHGVFITPIQILIIISAIVILVVSALIIHHTAFGRRIRALSEHTSAAQSLGINNKAISYGIFMIGAVLATYAGILIGYETNLQPTMGSAYTIKAFAAMILGGLGNIWGTVFGSYILGLIENLSIGLDFGGYSLPAGYKDAFAFAIILLMLLFRPQGIFNRRTRAS
jgi:branched-chain amino acid transport system permease protein